MFSEVSNSPIAKKTYMRNAVGMLRGDDWKRVRNIITPAFTTGKLKKVIPTINQCVKNSFGILESHAETGTPINVYDLLGRIGMDVIGRAGFSVDVDAYNEKESPFIHNVKGIFDELFNGWRPMFFFLCPWLDSLVQEYLGIDFFQTPKCVFFGTFLTKLYEKRKLETAEKRANHNDTFQFLMDTVEVSDETPTFSIGEDDFSAEKKITETENGWASKKKSLSKLELVSQGFLIFIAGYDTTGATTTFLLYNLALHPKIQERVWEEVDEVIGEDEDVTYEHMQKLVYLNQVIQETLRMFSIVTRLNRECSKETTVNGIDFKKGDLVNVPVYAMHHSPELYPDPEKFDPERFSADEKAKRDPLTYLPFGYGPRNCIGMRFAEFQMRVVVALIIKHFWLEKAANSPGLPIKLKCHDMLKPAETLYVKLTRR